MIRKFLFLILLSFLSWGANSQDLDKKKAIARIAKLESTYGQMAQKIWSLAEVGYKEKQSSLLLQETL